MSHSASLPNDFTGHALAIAGAIVLHSGIAAWAMQPTAPVVIPEQQIIQISMVAPSIVQQKPTPTPIIEKQATPKIPPREKGMVKVKPKQEVVKKVEKPKEKAEPVKAVKQQAQTQMTTGLAAPDAEQTKSALTEPVAADYLNNPPPQYPAKARLRKEQGTVLLDVYVSTSGAAKSVAVGHSSGVKTLDDAALAAVKQWKFVPARRGSEIVEAKVLVPVKFRLN